MKLHDRSMSIASDWHLHSAWHGVSGLVCPTGRLCFWRRFRGGASIRPLWRFKMRRSPRQHEVRFPVLRPGRDEGGRAHHEGRRRFSRRSRPLERRDKRMGLRPQRRARPSAQRCPHIDGLRRAHAPLAIETWSEPELLKLAMALDLGALQALLARRLRSPSLIA